MLRDPRLTPSHTQTKASAYSAICLFRMGPAALPSLFQSAGNGLTGIRLASAQFSPSLSTPSGHLPDTTSVMWKPESRMASSTSLASLIVLDPAIMTFMVPFLAVGLICGGAPTVTLALLRAHEVGKYRHPLRHGAGAVELRLLTGRDQDVACSVMYEWHSHPLSHQLPFRSCGPDLLPGPKASAERGPAGGRAEASTIRWVGAIGIAVRSLTPARERHATPRGGGSSASRWG